MVAALSHHDLTGSPSYPVYLSIRNLGNLSFMGEKSKPAMSTNNYKTKYPPQFESSNGQDSTGFPSWFVPDLGVASSDWTAEYVQRCIRTPRKSRPGTIPEKYPQSVLLLKRMMIISISPGNNLADPRTFRGLIGPNKGIPQISLRHRPQTPRSTN